MHFSHVPEVKSADHKAQPQQHGRHHADNMVIVASPERRVWVRNNGGGSITAGAMCAPYALRSLCLLVQLLMFCRWRCRCRDRMEVGWGERQRVEDAAVERQAIVERGQREAERRLG